MSYFITQHQVSIGKEISLEDQEAQHLGLSRRARKGESVKIQDPQGRRFIAEITEVRRNEVYLRVLREIAVPKEPSFKIGLFQALVSEQALDYILQKATELGVSEIYIFHAQHSPQNFEGERLVKKISRWQRIISAAAKQCDRAKIPQLQVLLTFDKALEKMAEYEIGAVLHPEVSPSLIAFLKPRPTLKSIGIGVGPEGGFSEAEIETLGVYNNIKAVSVGPRILRAETAATTSITIAQAAFGDLQ